MKGRCIVQVQLSRALVALVVLSGVAAAGPPSVTYVTYRYNYLVRVQPASGGQVRNISVHGNARVERGVNADERLRDAIRTAGRQHGIKVLAIRGGAVPITLPQSGKPDRTRRAKVWVYEATVIVKADDSDDPQEIQVRHHFLVNSGEDPRQIAEHLIRSEQERAGLTVVEIDLRDVHRFGTEDRVEEVVNKIQDVVTLVEGLLGHAQ